MSAASAAANGKPKRKRVALDLKHKRARSRVTNGATSFLKRLTKGRTVEARRFEDLLHMLVVDLGGADEISAAQEQVARRCAMLAVKCEMASCTW